MAKITQKQKVEMTRWFKPSNYDALKELSLREFYYEFIIRREMFERYGIAEDGTDSECLLEDVNKDEEASIFSGNPILTKMVNFVSPDDLQHDQHIKPLTYRRIESVRQKAVSTDIIKYDEHGRVAAGQTKLTEESLTKIVVKSLEKGLAKVDSSIRERRVKKASGIIFLELDLHKSTDSQIVASLAHLLPKWRTMMEVSTQPSKNTFFGEVMIQKLVNFNVIPLLDLMYFAKRYNFKFSDKDLEQLIYPWGVENPRDYVQIRETDRVIAERSLQDEFYNLFTMFMYRNPERVNKSINELLHEIAITQAAAK